MSEGGIWVPQEPHLGPNFLKEIVVILSPNSNQFQSTKCDVPKKIFLAKNFVVSHKAFFFEGLVAVCTFEAFGVPIVIEDF